MPDGTAGTQNAEVKPTGLVDTKGNPLSSENLVPPKVRSDFWQKTFAEKMVEIDRWVAADKQAKTEKERAELKAKSEDFLKGQFQKDAPNIDRKKATLEMNAKWAEEQENAKLTPEQRKEKEWEAEKARKRVAAVDFIPATPSTNGHSVETVQATDSVEPAAPALSAESETTQAQTPSVEPSTNGHSAEAMPQPGPAPETASASQSNRDLVSEESRARIAKDQEESAKRIAQDQVEIAARRAADEEAAPAQPPVAPMTTKSTVSEPIIPSSTQLPPTNGIERPRKSFFQRIRGMFNRNKPTVIQPEPAEKTQKAAPVPEPAKV